MSFNPKSDVILDVLKAADPSRASVAAERLAALGVGKTPPADFSASLNEADASIRQSAAAGFADARAHLAQAAGAPDKTARVKTEFEAMALGPFVNEILPKETSGLFGGGAVGDMWRSMLADQIGRQIAKSGALGLSRRLFATHALVAPHAKAALAGERTAQTSANVLSAPSGADVANGGALFAGKRPA